MQVQEAEDAVAWSAFCEALDFGALVPEAYEAYRPAVIEGLIFFLKNLDGDRTADLLADQLYLTKPQLTSFLEAPHLQELLPPVL